jgi:hypothetical protein
MEIRYSEAGMLEAPPEAVFDLRLDFTNLPAYNPNVSNLRRTDGGEDPGPGAVYEFDVTMPDMGGTIANVLTVLEAERPTRVLNQTESGPFVAIEDVRFEATGDGTQVTFDLTVRMPDDMAAIAELAETSGREQVRVELEHMAEVLDS